MVSIIIPVYNELEYIEELVDSISNNDPIKKEIILVDGGSNDGTLTKIHELRAKNDTIKLVHNPARFVSQGFNLAFKESKGEYLALIGAHAKYPHKYFSTCVAEIENGICDVAGGFLLQKGKGTIGQGIALAMSSAFGVGGVEFRTNPKRVFVDTVAFAVYKRSLFDKFGLLDEDLIRNQDDEFHYRLNKNGIRILLLPDLQTIYYVRNSYKDLWRQYFGYGLYKPLVYKKLKKRPKLKHIIPMFFFLYLLVLPLAFLYPIIAVPFILYLLSIVFIASSVLKNVGIWNRICCSLAFPVIHLAYGSGYIIGIIKFKGL